MATTQISGYVRLRFNDPEDDSENPKTKTLRVPGTIELLTKSELDAMSTICNAIATCIYPSITAREFIEVNTF